MKLIGATLAFSLVLGLVGSARAQGLAAFDGMVAAMGCPKSSDDAKVICLRARVHDQCRAWRGFILDCEVRVTSGVLPPEFDAAEKETSRCMETSHPDRDAPPVVVRAALLDARAKVFAAQPRCGWAPADQRVHNGDAPPGPPGPPWFPAVQKACGDLLPVAIRGMSNLITRVNTILTNAQRTAIQRELKAAATSAEQCVSLVKAGKAAHAYVYQAMAGQALERIRLLITHPEPPPDLMFLRPIRVNRGH
jgi:hypothetical protein